MYAGNDRNKFTVATDAYTLISTNALFLQSGNVKYSGKCEDVSFDIDFFLFHNVRIWSRKQDLVDKFPSKFKSIITRNGESNVW